MRQLATGSHQHSQQVHGLEDQEPPQESGVEGMTQLRASDAVGQNKYKTALEVQQEVFHWFDETLEPLARHGRPLLILIGSHGRLDNIDDEGSFIKDESLSIRARKS